MSDETKQVRIGLIGAGSISRTHLRAVDEIAEARLTAVCDIDAARADDVGKARGAGVYTDYKKLLDSGGVDAVLVATPHSSHVEIVKAALARDVHVLTEKPLGIHVKSAREAVAAAAKSRAKFGIVFQLRTLPLWWKAKELLDGGELGELRRAVWIATDLFRSQAYFSSADWRGTWAGEGGGLLLNQYPHQLDVFQWLVGMPDCVHAFLACGKYHDIEVEDDVTACMEWDNGMTGVFIAATGEFPGTNRLEISGDRGRMVVADETIVLDKTSVSVSEYTRTSARRMGGPAGDRLVTFPFKKKPNMPSTHIDILRNFVEAVLRDTPLVAPGAEGVKSLELANAMVYSGIEHETVRLPLDGEAYERLLQELCAGRKP